VYSQTPGAHVRIAAKKVPRVIIVASLAGLLIGICVGLNLGAHAQATGIGTSAIFAKRNFVNTTFTVSSCGSGSTCDWTTSSLSITIACNGCFFNGEYTSFYSSPITTTVSGTGTRTYYDQVSIDQAPALSWSVSKNSSAGMLEVKVGETGGTTYYDRTATLAFETLAGSWIVGVVYPSSSTSAATTPSSSYLFPVAAAAVLLAILVAAGLIAMRRKRSEGGEHFVRLVHA